MIPGKELLFGKIALREGLLTTRELHAALTEQGAWGERRPLGEILIEQGVLRPAQVEAVLGMQLKAMPSREEAATLEDCRGLLFGSVAVLHGLCTEQELNDALRIQASVEPLMPISLGEVLVKRGILTSEQVREVLRRQEREIFLCPACDIVFNWPSRDIAEGATPSCLECDGELLRGDATISRRYLVVRPTTPPALSLREPGDRPTPPPGPDPTDDRAMAAALHGATEEDTSARRRLHGNASDALYRLASRDVEDAMRAAGEVSARSPGPAPLDVPPDTPDALPVGPPESDTSDVDGSLERQAGSSPNLSTEPPDPPPSTPSTSTTRRWRRAPQSVTRLRIVTPEANAPASESEPASDDSVIVAREHRVGNYTVLKELGRGGMGVVHLARHIDDEWPRYAIKFLRKDLSGNDVYLRRFQREIALVLSLNHPGIVETFETGVTDGFHYMVMEYVDGKNLGDVLETSGKLPVSRAVAIVRQVAMALAFAHRQGIVHRDVKPDNIILTRGEHGDSVRITDFGLAKDLAGLDDALTLTGQLIGTPHYMAPEQCRGEYSDQRSDIYSLGCTFYHLLCGRPPYDGDNYLAVMENHRTEPIVPPHEVNPAVPQSISFIVGKMLEKEPNSRYPTMDLLISHLELWDSEQLADEIARFAPGFSRVRSFGGTDEFGRGPARRMQAELDAHLREERAEVERLRQRTRYLETVVTRQREVRTLLVVIGLLVMLLGMVLGLMIAGKGL